MSLPFLALMEIWLSCEDTTFPEALSSGDSSPTAHRPQDLAVGQEILLLLADQFSFSLPNPPPTLTLLSSDHVIYSVITAIIYQVDFSEDFSGWFLLVFWWFCSLLTLILCSNPPASLSISIDGNPVLLVLPAEILDIILDLSLSLIPHTPSTEKCLTSTFRVYQTLTLLTTPWLPASIVSHLDYCSSLLIGLSAFILSSFNDTFKMYLKMYLRSWYSSAPVNMVAFHFLGEKKQKPHTGLPSPQQLTSLSH